MSDFNFLDQFYEEICRLAGLGTLDLGEFITGHEKEGIYTVSLHLPEIVKVLRKHTIVSPLSVVSMVDVMSAHGDVFKNRYVNKPFVPIKHSVLSASKGIARIGMTVSGEKALFPKCLTDYLDGWLSLKDKLANPNLLDYAKVVNKQGKPTEYLHLAREGESEQDLVRKILAVLNTSKGVHWMVDLETLGTETDSAIVQAGLAPFSPLGEGLYIINFRGSWLSITFNATIHIPSQGRVIYQDTLNWWHTKNAANAHLLNSGTLTLPNLLVMLEVMLGKKAELWANSPVFDIALLQDCYKTVGRDIKNWPIAFRDQWDVRTVSKVAGFNKSTLPSVYVKANDFWQVESNAHDALADVFTQIYQVQESYRKLKVNKRVATDLLPQVIFYVEGDSARGTFLEGNLLESADPYIKLSPPEGIQGISNEGGLVLSFKSASDIDNLISKLTSLRDTIGEQI